MRFYFNLRSEDGLETDEEGMELASLVLAEQEAQKAAREMISERILRDEKIDGMTFEIIDDEGRVLSTVPFREMIRL